MSTPETQVFVSNTQTNVVTVQTPGPQGPTGPLGNPGPTGPASGPTGPTGPVGPSAAPVFDNPLSAALAGGNNDDFSPFGYIPGFTNCLILTPVSGSALLGLASSGAPQGFTLLLMNASATIPFTIPSQSSDTAANTFFNSNNATITVPPLMVLQVVYLVGDGWSASGPSYSTQLVTSGGTATVNAKFLNTNTILDGVDTTFALTFPVAFADGQIVAVLSHTAISVAFSVVGSGDGSTINGVPATTSADTGIAWQYLASDTTWYRLY